MTNVKSNIQEIKTRELQSIDGGILPLIAALVLYDVGAQIYEDYTGEDLPTSDDLF